MLTSVGQSDDQVHRHRNSIDAFLTKPVKHSDLLEALSQLFGVSTKDGRTEPAAERIGSKPRRTLQVLVAEDNLVNRQLVTTLLKKRGHKVKAVDNGRKAVASIKATTGPTFDLVLMDLQMPEMGGFEAAQAIREWENEGASSARLATGKRLPLIALTAHAMQGDRERCLQSGMDGYLSKPIDVDELIATVERFGGGPPSKRVASARQQADGSIFDERAALSYSGGDRRLLKNVIKLFRSDYPSALRRIDRALRRRDAEALRLAAHGLKGAIATMGAPAGRQAAADLEQTARSQSFDEAERASARLRDEIERLEEAFAAADLIARPARRPAASRKRRSPQRKRRPS
jgi:two-component system, sensor histidine kinase and response regulator